MVASRLLMFIIDMAVKMGLRAEPLAASRSFADMWSVMVPLVVTIRRVSGMGRAERVMVPQHTSTYEAGQTSGHIYRKLEFVGSVVKAGCED